MEDAEKVLTSVRASCNLYLSILQLIVLTHPRRERLTADIRDIIVGYETNPPESVPKPVLAQMESQGLNFLQGL